MRLFTTHGFFIFLSIIFFTNMATGQSPEKDSVKNSHQIINIEQNLMDAIAKGDTVIWKRYLDDKFMVITEDGTRFNKLSFIKTLHPLPKGFSGWIKVIQPQLVFNDNTAVITYVADEHEFVFGQELHTTYSSTNTYYKDDTTWKMIASQIFEIPQLPPSIKLPAASLKKFSGVYQLTDTITCLVSVENDSLFITKKGRPKEALYPETENVFFISVDTRGRKFFVPGENGTMLMRERRNGEDVVWKKIK